MYWTPVLSREVVQLSLTLVFGSGVILTSSHVYDMILSLECDRGGKHLSPCL